MKRAPHGCRWPQAPRHFHRRKAEAPLKHRDRGLRRSGNCPPFGGGNVSVPAASGNRAGRASMGPPPFGGGNSAAGLKQLITLILLQWGLRLSAVEIRVSSAAAAVFRSCFNGASAFRRWKSGRTVTQAYRRRDASMGPPPFGGGNDNFRFVVILCLGASMGPPPFGGGNAREHGVLRSRCELQWGLRLSAVEIISDGIGRDGVPKASMGPPPFGGGNFLAARAPAFLVGGFNGASAFRRWKFRPVGGALRPARLASMGPPPFGGGNPTDIIPSPRSARPLQWGLRLSAVEMHTGGRANTSRRSLQWGLRLSAVEMPFAVHLKV